MGPCWCHTLQQPPRQVLSPLQLDGTKGIFPTDKGLFRGRTENQEEPGRAHGHRPGQMLSRYSSWELGEGKHAKLTGRPCLVEVNGQASYHCTPHCFFLLPRCSYPVHPFSNLVEHGKSSQSHPFPLGQQQADKDPAVPKPFVKD